MTEKDDIVEITWSFPAPYGKGKSSDEQQPIIHPTLDLFEQGLPPGHFTLAFSDVAGPPWRIIGGLCQTVGKRILYLPGLTNKEYRSTSTILPTVKDTPQTMLIDHVTLESDLQSWQISLQNKDILPRLPRQRTREITENLLHWFDLYLRNPSVLEQVPESLTCRFAVPGGDSERRIDTYIDSREGSEFHLISINKQDTYRAGTYLALRFLISPVKIEEEIDYDFIVPTGPPVLRSNVHHEKEIKYRCHSIKIPECESNIVIISSLHDGDLVEDALIVPPRHH